MDTTTWSFSVRYRGRNILPVIAVLLFAAGALAGWLAGEKRAQDTAHRSRGVEVRQQGYTLINPLLECEVAKEHDLFDELTPFKDKVAALVKERTDSYKLSHLSIYFRDLNNGIWFGINEKELFSPASLLKVPTLIACLKQAETDPSFLKRRIHFKGGEDLNAGESIKPRDPIRPGRSYTIDELLTHMIVGSDNNANTLVFNAIDKKLLLKTYQDLGVKPPLRSTPVDYLTVKNYAAFFRILFNASYLNKEMSHRALALLAEADFKEGIVAGVPSTVAVAHKFGERRVKEQPGGMQLHDCGIVYYPDYPYLLCIMSRGSDLDTLDDIIRDVSRLVYQEVDRQRTAR